MFGITNATITEIYKASDQSTDIYGSRNTSAATSVSHKAWFEKTTSESRQIGGDTFKRQAKLVTSHLDDLEEGNVITVVPNQIGSETEQTTRKWKIENCNRGYSSVINNRRIRRIELNLIEEAS